MLLLINDDGIDAPGLAALERAVADCGPRLVLAPDRHLSGCGHQATTHRPLQVTPRGERRHMIDGTPADCTRVGLVLLAPDTTWVISGINEGGNLGADVYMSGTVAAVREGALLGRLGIALSHYVKRGMPVDWDQAAAWAAAVVPRLQGEAAPPGTYWNVNLPHLASGSALPEVVFCGLDPNPLPVAYRQEDGRLHYHGNYHQRPRDPGSDVDVCFSGRIAVTRLNVRG